MIKQLWNESGTWEKVIAFGVILVIALSIGNYAMVKYHQNKIISLIEELEKLECTDAGPNPIYGSQLVIINKNSNGKYYKCGDRYFYI